MSIKDIIKDSVYKTFAGSSGLSFWEVGWVLLAALLCGLFIYLIYRLFTKSTFYSKDMNITLAGTVVVVAAIMVAMQSSLVVALGMVGALSIVRFRTAVKSPLDLLYLFWSISIGIICGVRLYTLAAVLCIMMTVLIFILSRLPGSKAPVLAVIRVREQCSAQDILSILKKHSKRIKENSVVMKNNEREYIYEIFSPDRDMIIEQMSKLDGMVSVNILSHSGEMRA